MVNSKKGLNQIDRRQSIETAKNQRNIFITIVCQLFFFIFKFEVILDIKNQNGIKKINIFYCYPMVQINSFKNQNKRIKIIKQLNIAISVLNLNVLIKNTIKIY
ncbi:hypothetical protein BpHYR1_044011 [Brachionus plicatilis]|uniref:Transmembrane protein n=1 Tax=Brachionus plicatilis TaxID=10195 RepID=A0A3M7PTT1_BRAPC|nr:hypothetical protein BpHYR1_044011 [Brachionus plicatilis]